MDDRKFYSMLGLAMKAGKISSGEFMTENKVKSFESSMVITAADASENTKKKFRDMCSFYETPFAAAGSKEDLGRAIGKEFRASLSVNDPGFAKAILKILEQ